MGTKWGQNFLASQRYARRIVDHVPDVAVILEIGPGRGILTRELLERGAVVHAVEIDPTLCERLRHDLPAQRCFLHNADILEFDFDQVGPAPVFAVGNIPYQITSPLIERILGDWRRWTGFLLLLQKEVADRISATPGSRNYSALSVMVAAAAQPTKLFDIHRSHFLPRPEVDSTLVSFSMRPLALVEDFAAFAGFLKKIFSQRRKKLSNSLRLFFQGDRPPAGYEWLDLDRRIEAVDVASIARLFDQIQSDPSAGR